MSNIKLIMNLKTASTSQEELVDVSNNITLNTPIHQPMSQWLTDMMKFWRIIAIGITCDGLGINKNNVYF